MLDSDVARLYEYETKRVNEIVKRNIKRFPEDFYFQLTVKENLRSQFATSSLGNKNRHGGRRYCTYVFTEKGIIMLASLLKSDIAISVSLRIVEAFVEMRNFINTNKNLFERVITIENTLSTKLLEHDKKFDEIFDQLQSEVEFRGQVFYNGQIYDAHSLLIDIIKQAKKDIVIIDNYIDKTVLDLLTNKKDKVDVTIIGSNKCNLSQLDINKFNNQYPKLKLIYSDDYHDRFMIIDHNTIYHCGASLKDLGKKTFDINKMVDKSLLDRLYVKE